MGGGLCWDWDYSPEVAQSSEKDHLLPKVTQQGREDPGLSKTWALVLIQDCSRGFRTQSRTVLTPVCGPHLLPHPAQS